MVCSRNIAYKHKYNKERLKLQVTVSLARQQIYEFSDTRIAFRSIPGYPASYNIL